MQQEKKRELTTHLFLLSGRSSWRIKNRSLLGSLEKRVRPVEREVERMWMKQDDGREGNDRRVWQGLQGGKRGQGDKMGDSESPRDPLIMDRLTETGPNFAFSR